MSLVLRVSVAGRPNSGQRFVGSGPEIVVGRSTRCDLRLPGARASARHLMLRWDPAAHAYTAEDLGSTNGTRLNGRPLVGGEAPLSPGDTLAVGRFEMLVVEWGAPAEARQAPPEGAPGASAGRGAARRVSSSFGAWTVDLLLLLGVAAALSFAVWLLAT